MNLLNPMDDDQLDAIIEGLERIKELEAEVARLRDVISRAASHWIHLDPGVAWEGDIADAMAAAVAEIARLRLTDAEVTFLRRERDLLDADDEGDRKTLEIIAGLLARLGGRR